MSDVTAKVDDPNFVDWFVVDSLVQRYPVPNAKPQEREAAVLVLFGRGLSLDEIAVVLSIPKDAAKRVVSSSRRRAARKALSR